MIKDLVNNIDNEDYKTIVNGKKYDLKNAEKFLLKIINKKTTENEAHELYNNFVKPGIFGLEKSTSRNKDKRNTILNILSNLELVFTDVYLDYSDKPSESEEYVAERTKLRRQRFNETAQKEKMISSKLFEEYFNHLSPSDMYKALNEITGSEKNNVQVNAIEKRLTNLVNILKNNLRVIQKNHENRTRMLEIAELILYFNKQNQRGQGLKLLTPSQMLSRLPIILAQLKSGNSSKKLKNEFRQLLYVLYRPKKQPKQSITI